MRENARLWALVEETATRPSITAAIPAAVRSSTLLETASDMLCPFVAQLPYEKTLPPSETKIMARGWAAVSATVLCLGALALLCAHYGGKENAVDLQEDTPKALPIAFAEEAERCDSSLTIPAAVF